MATACAFFPLGKCLRASAKPPPRKKGALRQRWIANGDPCRYVLRAELSAGLSAGLRTGYRPAGRRAGVCAAGWVAVRLGQSKLY